MLPGFPSTLMHVYFFERRSDGQVCAIAFNCGKNDVADGIMNAAVCFDQNCRLPDDCAWSEMGSYAAHL
ncbi:MAG: hypothetical protein K2Y39_25350 [Candidatus Obscuribacterales bacterium]|nr:hypothetical protein [Candidatus Obscuribacterales bacterium]